MILGRGSRIVWQHGGGVREPHRNEKADVVERPQAFHHVGLLANGSPATAGYPLSSRPTSLLNYLLRVELLRLLLG